MRYVHVPIVAATDDDIPKMCDYDDLVCYVEDLWSYYNVKNFNSSLYTVNYILINDCDEFFVRYSAVDSISYGKFVIKGEIISFSPAITKSEDLFRQVLLREMYRQANNESDDYIAPEYSDTTTNRDSGSSPLNEDELEFVDFHTHEPHVAPYSHLRIGDCYKTFVRNADGKVKTVICRIAYKKNRVVYFVYHDALKRKDIVHRTRYGTVPFIYATKKQRRKMRGKLPMSLIRQYREKCAKHAEGS